MKLERFKELTDSYGADLRRWPRAECDAADELLEYSPQARLLLGAARTLDNALEKAAVDQGAVHWNAGELQSALVRLRMGVSRRISRVPPSGETPAWRWAWALLGPIDRRGSFQLAGVRLVTSSAIVTVAGVLIGWLQTPQPALDWISILESAPLRMLTH
jgi:hypothetical protein